jgi:EAL domain-containing protein (putative c-di-GMP-specific phosphodiesterase class I)
MAPGDFIPVAEHSGLIVPIGEWVLAEACTQGARWHEAGLPLRISVNLSPRQLGSNELVDLLAGLLRRTGLPPEALSLELTESALMDDAPATQALLAELKALGVRLMLDDFGTGYSSLRHLRHHPIDAIKVDRSFVTELDSSGESAAIVEAVVAMGRSLGLEVIAEGVERPEHVARLRELGCGLAQGYLFAPPLPAADITARAVDAGARPGV